MTEAGDSIRFVTVHGDDLEDLFVRIDLHDRPITVAAQFEQETSAIDPTNGSLQPAQRCTETIIKVVEGYRHFFLANCDRLRYSPRRLVIACGDGTFGSGGFAGMAGTGPERPGPPPPG